MSNEYVFHIRNANPGDMAAALAALELKPGLNSIAEIVQTAEEIGFVVNDRKRLEALATARDLLLVKENENVLTQAGQALAKIDLMKPDLFPEIIHGMQYKLWTPSAPSANCFSWSYRILSELLWHSGSVLIENRRELASKVESQARDEFDIPDISFSPKSIGGALLWLSSLKAPVISDDSDGNLRFLRRGFCPPELFAMAIDYFYDKHHIEHGTNLLIHNVVRDTICQMCLLEAAGFDRVLEYTVAQFEFIEKGIGGGWGQYLVLRRSVKLEDFL